MYMYMYCTCSNYMYVHVVATCSVVVSQLHYNSTQPNIYTCTVWGVGKCLKEHLHVHVTVTLCEWFVIIALVMSILITTPRHA